MEPEKQRELEREIEDLKEASNAWGVRYLFGLAAIAIANAAISSAGGSVLSYIWNVVERALTVVFLASIGFVAGEIVVRAEDRKGRILRAVAVIAGLLVLALVLVRIL